NTKRVHPPRSSKVRGSRSHLRRGFRLSIYFVNSHPVQGPIHTQVIRPMFDRIVDDTLNQLFVVLGKVEPIDSAQMVSPPHEGFQLFLTSLDLQRCHAMRELPTHD